jgi:hypothetical protein
MDRYYPDWIDNNFSTQKLMHFKEHSRIRRLELIEQEKDEEDMSGTCPLIMWQWNEKQEGPERRSSPSAGMPHMVARGPYNSNSVWNLLDAAMDSSTPLFTIKEDQ